MSKSAERKPSPKSITEPGRYGYGNGLYLNVSKSGSRSWLFLYRSKEKGPLVISRRGRSKPKHGNRVVQMGLGSAESMGQRGLTLPGATARVEQLREMLAKGVDPLAQKRAKTVRLSNFGSYADAFFARIKDNFENEKHREQWERTLQFHCKPIRSKPIGSVTIQDIRALLAPLWKSVPETASRVRGRLDRIFNSAVAEGLYEGVNPASLQIHQAILGQPIADLKDAQHHAAIPYKEMPDFMKRLRGLGSVSALALEYLILTIARTGEVREAQWGFMVNPHTGKFLNHPDKEFEIDRKTKLWTVPTWRMKARKTHMVPLVPRALEILDKVEGLRDVKNPHAYIFPGGKKDHPLSDAAMSELLKGIRPGITVHGFRSAFSDWVGDCTNFDAETREFCLAHHVNDKTEAAYRRSTSVEKRRAVLTAWAKFLAIGK